MCQTPWCHPPPPRAPLVCAPACQTTCPTTKHNTHHAPPQYSPPHTLGLNIRNTSIVTHIQAINQLLRYTHNNGPSHANERVTSTLCHKSTNPNTIQLMTAHSALFLGFHTHNIPTVNPCLPFQIPTHTTIEVPFNHYQSNSNPPTYSITKNTTHTTKTTLWFQGIVDHPLPRKTTVTFPDMSTILTPKPPVSLPYSPHIPGYFQVYQASLTTRHDQHPFFFHWHKNHSKFHSTCPKKYSLFPKISTPTLLGMPRSFSRTRNLPQRYSRLHRQVE